MTLSQLLNQGRHIDMRINRMQQVRMSALIIGTTAALACSGGGENANTAGESGAASAATASGDTGAMATPGAAAMAGADSAAMGGEAMGDAAIMGTVNTSNAAEITTSELAQERAQNSQVKTFARDMITEHRKMQKEADQLAQKANVTAQPAGKADQMQQMVASTTDSLKALNGAQFDQKYMAFQVQSHQTTLDNLRRFETQAQNADLKAMITKAIPAVQGHLERAQKIQTSLGGAAGATKS
jgi:putative membrane protein